MLVGVKDVSVVAINEIRDRGDDAFWSGQDTSRMAEFFMVFVARDFTRVT